MSRNGPFFFLTVLSAAVFLTACSGKEAPASSTSSVSSGSKSSVASGNTTSAAIASSGASAPYTVTGNTTGATSAATSGSPPQDTVPSRPSQSVAAPPSPTPTSPKIPVGTSGQTSAPQTTAPPNDLPSRPTSPTKPPAPPASSHGKLTDGVFTAVDGRYRLSIPRDMVISGGYKPSAELAVFESADHLTNIRVERASAGADAFESTTKALIEAQLTQELGSDVQILSFEKRTADGKSYVHFSTKLPFEGMALLSDWYRVFTDDTQFTLSLSTFGTTIDADRLTEFQNTFESFTIYA